MEKSDIWKRAKKKQHYQLQEENLAEGPAGRKQINSGRTWFSKRDVKRHGYLIEARSVGHNKDGEPIKTYSVKADELVDLEKNAIFHNALPGIQIDFERTGGRYILTRLQDWEAEQEERTALERDVITLQQRVRQLENDLADYYKSLEEEE